jgi:hypothetical protein
MGVKAAQINVVKLILGHSLKLSCDCRFQRAFIATFAFSKKLPWLAQTSEITLKMQPHAENTR